MNKFNIKQLKEEITQTKVINYDRSFELSKICSNLLRSDDTVEIGRDLVIRILDAWEKIESSTHDMWNYIVEAFGLYPYLQPNYLQGASLLRHEFHRSKYLKKTYFHEDHTYVIILQSHQYLFL